MYCPKCQRWIPEEKPKICPGCGQDLRRYGAKDAGSADGREKGGTDRLRLIVLSVFAAILLGCLVLTGVLIFRVGKKDNGPAEGEQIAAKETPGSTEEPTEQDGDIDPSDPESTDPALPDPTDPEPVTQIMEVDERYFSDALFIGDSRTDGLRLYAPIEGAVYYCGTSMNIFKVMDSDYSAAGYKGLRNLLKNETYGKIYIMFGINEAGYDTEVFAAKFRAVVEEIRSYQPNAIIYIQSILYVTQKHENSYPVFSSENLKEKNAKLKEMANGVDIFYLEVNDVLNDGTDHLPSDYTGDGVHLKANYYHLWQEYLMANAVVDPGHPWPPEDED